LEERIQPIEKYLPSLLKCYGNSLFCDKKNVYHILPRILTLWLEAGDIMMDCMGKKKTKSKKNVEIFDKLMNSINSSIAPFIDGGYPFPNYIWFTSLSQLVSRICYENENIRGMITNIIINILLEYPQQSIWSLLPVANSNSDDHETRKKTALEIFKTAKNKSKSIKNYEILQILEEAQLFFDTMLEICEYKNSTKQKEFSKYEFFNMISIF
jgi:hypothetical protein